MEKKGEKNAKNGKKKKNEKKKSALEGFVGIDSRSAVSTMARMLWQWYQCPRYQFQRCHWQCQRLLTHQGRRIQREPIHYFVDRRRTFEQRQSRKFFTEIETVHIIKNNTRVRASINNHMLSKSFRSVIRSRRWNSSLDSAFGPSKLIRIKNVRIIKNIISTQSTKYDQFLWQNHTNDEH